MVKAKSINLNIKLELKKKIGEVQEDVVVEKKIWRRVQLYALDNRFHKEYLADRKINVDQKMDSRRRRF